MAPSDFKSDVVQFVFDAEDIQLPGLSAWTSTLTQLLREVEHAVAPGETFRWRIRSLSMRSPLTLELVPVATVESLGPGPARDVAKAVNEGLRAVQEGTRRPEFFTDRALVKAKELVQAAHNNHARLSIGSVGPYVALTSEVVAHIDAILGTTVTSIGTVEGTLEAFNVHGSRREFTVYDALTGQRITCNFGRRFDAAAIGAAAERRIAVHGEIKYREGGDIVAVTVQSFDVFPDDSELPSADDVRGILEG